ncbi:MAG: polyamine aminopropyltransferase [Betaproteobacteria bacterium]|nr:polyamine aminopropyltransferase [Betaproteobacteria bacterium]
MNRLRSRKGRGDDSGVQVSEEKGIRSLYLGSDTVQSSMRLSDPVELVLSYTRAMMGFLLFHENPRHFLMIGLGGGSLAKFAYHTFPRAHVTVVEKSERVIAAARNFFFVPADDERFVILPGDGADHVRRRSACCDVLMVDGYDSQAQVESLATEDFYAQCHDALQADGVLVVNLWSTDRRFDMFLQRIERVFEGRVLCLPAERKGNVAVFAMRGRIQPTRWDQLRERARVLQASTGLEFPEFVSRLADLNPHGEHRLLV